jgi:hypothetical protein
MLNSKSSIKEWIEKYPFLRIKDNSVYPWLSTSKDSYEDCWMVDDLPDGWIDAFGEQMCDELADVLGEYADRWITLQVKEKFGSIRWYYYFNADGLPEEVEKINQVEQLVSNIIDKYEEISYHTCAYCGAPATRKTTGWILPVCDVCFNEQYKK